MPNILENIGCHSITEHRTEYRAGLPDDSNKTKVSVKKETLSGRIYLPEGSLKGDIISIVMQILDIKFLQALKEIHKILKIPFKIKLNQENEKKNPLEIFENIRKKNRCNNIKIKAYDDSVLDKYNYIKLPHMDLVRESIVPSVQREFDVMYDVETRRILFPHRHWSSGEILGVFGRTTVENYDLFDIPKYYGILPYPKSLNLYGLFQNYKSIQEAGYVIVLEGEKSVLKAKSLGFDNCVSLGGHELSEEQIKILIGLNVDIIFALDKDMSKDLSIQMCNELKSCRNTSYIYDKYDLLEEKDSPIDKGKKIFEYLLKYKIEVI